MEKLELPAYAKINLFLDITGKREDGYHEINTVMQTVSLCDGILLQISEGEGISVECGNTSVPGGRDNIAYRAAELFIRKYGSGKLGVRIEKRIPMAAGLAGGSADAAAVLRGINTLLGNPASLEELCRIGAGLGADVPFCIVGGCSAATGVGEVLSPLPIIPYCKIIIAIGNDSVSTPGAYRDLDSVYGNFKNYKPNTDGYKALREGILSGSLNSICDGMYNIFEKTVENQCKSVALLRKTMFESGALAAMMSGSGPSVFGIFDADFDAHELINKIKSGGMSVFECRPIANIGG